MTILDIDVLEMMVSEMRIRDKKDKSFIFKTITSQTSLIGKCIMARKYLNPQSTTLEKICKIDLKINDPLDNISGDGHKNGINYEIKISIHSNKSKINYVQIRPNHNIDCYIFIAYNMYEDNDIGRAYIFKIPAYIVYDLIVQYGSYAHGTYSILGEITSDNMKKRNCEYALRCNPNSKNGKNYQLWNEFKKYEVEYDSINF